MNVNRVPHLIGSPILSDRDATCGSCFSWVNFNPFVFGLDFDSGRSGLVTCFSKDSPQYCLCWENYIPEYE